MQPHKNISLAVIKRLPSYYRYLEDTLDDGITRISSKDLSKRMGVTASQIRQDLNNFGCFGQQGYGYNTELLYGEIKKILGLEKQYSMIIIGAGNIGQALVNHISFQKRGFNFTAVFDVNPKLIGLTIQGIEVFGANFLSDYLSSTHVDIAVLSLPGNSASDIAQKVIAGGVKGIWNFSNIDIKAPDDVKVENVHLMDSLMTLSYKLNEKEILSKFGAGTHPNLNS